MLRLRSSLALWLWIVCGGCAIDSSAVDAMAALRDHVSLSASFDHGPDADVARGDPRIFTAPSYRKLDEAKVGIGNPSVGIAKGRGVRGDALEFREKNTHAIFYRAKDNIATDGDGLTCTVSFWLNLDPDRDLEPGYCDPVQITDRSFKDGAVWVDFTKDETPRRFRLGVFGDLDAWNPDNLPVDDHPAFEARLIAVDRPPFTRGTWHQVTLVVDTPNGRAGLYIDGVSQGHSLGIDESFQWELDQATVRLGIHYVGLFDELVAFDRALTAAEVRLLFDAETVARPQGR